MTELVVSYLILLAISTFLSLCEISILTVNPIKFEKLVEKRPYLDFFQKKKDSAALDLMTINFTVDNLGSMYLSYIFSSYFVDDKVLIMAASGITTLTTLQVATLGAKMLASRHAECVLTVLGRLIITVYYICKPLAFVLSIPMLIIIRIFFKSSGESRLTDGELLGVLAIAKKEGLIGVKPHRLILRLIEMQNKTVGDLIPKEQKVESVDIEANILDLKDKMLKGAHKRLIVTKTYKDKMYPIGILTFKDIVKANVEHIQSKIDKKVSSEVRSIASVMHPCVVTPMSEKANTLINKLDKGDHIVIVTDKEGCVKGVLQSDDIIHSLTSNKHTDTEEA